MDGIEKNGQRRNTEDYDFGTNPLLRDYST